MKRLIQNIFGLRKDVGLNFYIADLFFRKILRQNADTRWAIHHTSTVLVPQNITRGKNVYPGDSPNNFIEALNGIEIGDYTNIGPNVGIHSTSHDAIDNSKFTKAPPIKIGRFCWIGMNAVILPGVELGDFTVVGAGAVVTKSFPAGYCVLGENPARVLKQLDVEACKQFSDAKYAS
ncbi:MAG: acyltransferase [Chitinophagaceae bacterium]|nr:MAG: acyltransferase [Chitinophagaceae bacterium]